MTGSKGNSEFCFPETITVPRGEPEGNTEMERKQKSLFPEGPVIQCFVIPPNSKMKNEKLQKNDLLDAYEGCACSTSGSQTELQYRNDAIIFFFFAANENFF